MPVKPKYIKDISKKVREEYPNAVCDEYETNKQLVNEVTNVTSKTIRNRVAGHITRKQKSKVERQNT